MANTKVTGDLIADATITATNIADGAVTAEKLTGITTTSIAEGDKLFYTDARVGTYLSTNGYDTAANIIATITDSAPVTLDTLNELAAALGDDPNYATTTANLIGTKLPLAGGTLTGNLIVNASVGIGMTPAKTLDLQNTDNLAIRLYNGASFKAGIEVATTAGDMVGSSAIDDLGIRSQSNILFATGGNTERLRIDSSGRVGIGINNPSSYDSNADNLVIGSTGANDKNGITIVGGDTDGRGAIYFADTTQNSAGYITYFHSNNSMLFGTSDSTAMRIDSSGNVGIGKNSQSGNATLTVKSPAGGNTGVMLIEGDTTNDGHGLYATTDNKFVITRFTNGSYSDNFVMDSSGKVGIGTTSPSEKLEVNGKIRVNRTDDTTQYGLFAQDSSGGYIQFHRPAGSGLYENFRFIASNNDGQVERLRIDTSGNVGLGVGTNPTNALLTNPGRGNLTVNGSSDSIITLGMGGTWYSYYYVDASNTYIASNGGNIQLQPGGSTKMYLASGGNVGIGTTSPAAKLDITKNDSATSLLIRNGDVNNGGNNEAQIQFGFNGTDDFSHFIRTRHNSADSGGNAIDFYTCDSTENNSITSGVRHNLTLESGNVGIGTTSPATKLHILDNFDPNDNLGYVLVENTNTTSGGSQTNSAVNVRNYHGTSQFMQWENHGLRIGSRRLTNSGTGDIIFTAGADEEKMRLLAGGGLTFNGDTAAANALDDYEEGTWTPILSWNSGGDYTMDNGTTVGRYTKIGNLVYATCTIKWTAAPSSTSGNLVVRGLPFTIATIRNAGCFSASLGGIYFSSSTYTQWTITGDPGRDDMYIIQQGSGVYSHRPTVSSTGTVYSISLTYRV